MDVTVKYFKQGIKVLDLNTTQLQNNGNAHGHILVTPPNPTVARPSVSPFPKPDIFYGNPD